MPKVPKVPNLPGSASIERRARRARGGSARRATGVNSAVCLARRDLCGSSRHPHVGRVPFAGVDFLQAAATTCLVRVAEGEAHRRLASFGRRRAAALRSSQCCRTPPRSRGAALCCSAPSLPCFSAARASFEWSCSEERQIASHLTWQRCTCGAIGLPRAFLTRRSVA